MSGKFHRKYFLVATLGSTTIKSIQFYNVTNFKIFICSIKQFVCNCASLGQWHHQQPHQPLLGHKNYRGLGSYEAVFEEFGRSNLSPVQHLRRLFKQARVRDDNREHRGSVTKTACPQQRLELQEIGAKSEGHLFLTSSHFSSRMQHEP